jgi:hypothetical protein
VSRDSPQIFEPRSRKSRGFAGFWRSGSLDSEPETAGFGFDEPGCARLSLLPVSTVRFGDPAGRGRAGNAVRVRSESQHPARHDHGRLQIEIRPRPFFAISPYIGRRSLDVVSDGWSRLVRCEGTRSRSYRRKAGWDPELLRKEGRLDGRLSFGTIRDESASIADNVCSHSLRIGILFYQDIHFRRRNLNRCSASRGDAQ